MTLRSELPTETTSASVWRRVVTEPRRTMWPFARDVVFPFAAFLGPLLSIVLIQCYSFGCHLFLGWDSSTYAWWATLFQEKGALTMILQWHYPQLYVLLLSGFGSTIGSVNTAEHILPLLASLPLGYAYYSLTMRLTSDKRLGLFACFVGGISIATIEMVSDVQRNLLAFGIALPLGASIYLNVFAGTANPKRIWKKSLAVWIPLLLVVLSTQIETYVVLSITLLLASAFSRKWSSAFQGVALVSAPVLLASPLMIGYFLRYGVETAKLLPLGPSATFDWTWLYLSGFAIPIGGVGIMSLTRLSRRHHPIARYILLWLVTLAILVPVALLINVPPTRLLLFIPLPILLALAVPYMAQGLAKTWHSLRTRSAWIGQLQTAAHAHRGSGHSFSERAPVTLSLLVAFLIVATPVVFTTALNKDQFRPFVSEAEVARLWDAAGWLRQDGYRDAIIVLYEGRAALFAPVFRAYFGMEMPDNLAYYGKLQFLFSLPDPQLVLVWKYDQRTEGSYSTTFRDEILGTIGASGIVSRPIVIAGGTTYTAALSEMFLSRFERSPGTYVIPPGSLSSLEIDSWRLFAAYDCLVCRQGSPLAVNWSQSPYVLEYRDLSGSGAFDATYALSLVRSWANGNLTIRFFDFTPILHPAGGPDVVLGPLEVYFDGNLVLSHSYTSLGPIAITIPTGLLSAGVHRIEMKSGSPGIGVAMNVDDFELTPSP